ADGLARISVVGSRRAIEATARRHGIDLGPLQIIDPANAAWQEQFQQTLLALRSKRGMTSDMAAAAVQQPLIFAMLMLREGYADGSVAGAVHTTADVVRSAIQIVGPRHDASLVSSFFLMLRDEPFHTNAQAMIFSDCGLVVDPNEDELTQIA